VPALCRGIDAVGRLLLVVVSGGRYAVLMDANMVAGEGLPYRDSGDSWVLHGLGMGSANGGGVMGPGVSVSRNAECRTYM